MTITISFQNTITITPTSGSPEEIGRSLSLGTQSITKTAKGSWEDTVAVSTSEGSISSFGGLSTLGFGFLENCGSNAIQVGSATGVYFGYIPAGKAFPWYFMAGITLYHIAIGGNSSLKIHIEER